MTATSVLFAGPRWKALAEAGAKTQRLLWASTSAKNPSYRDTIYVESLIGADTVNTMPPATMDAFRDHGEIIPDAIEQDLAGARTMLSDLESHGVSLDHITRQLVEDGVGNSQKRSTSCSPLSPGSAAFCSRAIA